MLTFVSNSVSVATGNSISSSMSLSLIRKIKHTYRQKCWNTAREHTVSMAMSMVFGGKSRDKFGGKGAKEQSNVAQDRQPGGGRGISGPVQGQ